MKKLFLSILISSLFLTSRADEGMWLPFLIKLNEGDMQTKGMKLSAENIYSINKSSLKDAIVQFGGGCTGEIISNEGLLLTNHHCGYGQIQSHSSVQHDYLTDGFWAMNRSEELTNPGLTATFIIRMEDVTKKVFENITATASEKVRDSIIRKNISAITKESIKGTHYEAFIRPFYNGNEYYMFVTETFKDVRLVGAPPSSIGKFGSDADNWMWPRHTGDFSIFRIYANKDNKPAEYSPDNVPLKPRHFLPISIKGVQEGDFTMVYGFPGRTTEYLTSYAVDLIMNVSDPAKINIREKRLAMLDEDMRKDAETRIKYSAKYAGIANYWKKWIGEVRGLKKLNAVESKQNFEKEFLSRVNSKEEFKQYADLLSRYKDLYAKMNNYQKAFDYYGEALMGIEILKFASSYASLVDAYNKPDAKKEDLDKMLNSFKSDAEKYFKDYNAATDKKVFVELMKLYSQDVATNQQSAIFTEVQKKHKGDFTKLADKVYSKSVFASQQKLNALLNSFTKDKIKTIEKDEAYKLSKEFTDFYKSNILSAYSKTNTEILALNRNYMKALREVMTEKKYYPDANSTLRIAYGNVSSYMPADGVKYNYYTTIDGIFEKEDSANYDFVVPKKLKELYKKKDYGMYADKNGDLRICFIASNHTTGGNSGSPVIDAEGNLIGTNFDRSWESTMSDIMFDPDRCRNIVLDARYTLFVIDKFAGAGYLLNEMKIVR